MIRDNIHHPATNGSTKKMVWLSLIFIFIITMIALIFTFIATFHLTGIELWLVKGLFGSIAMTGLAALVAVTRKFFDTRTAEIKTQDKLLLKQERHKYLLEKRRLKK